MLRRLLITYLVCPVLVFSQLQEREIDSLIFRKTKKLRSEAKYEELISVSKRIIQHSNVINYTRGEAWGHSRLGNAYCTLGKYKESLDALDKARVLSTSVDDYGLKASIATETGRNYSESKISINQAIEQFKLAESFAKKISDQYDRESYLLYAYQSLLSAYSQMNRIDLALPFAWKAKAIEEDAYVLSFLTYHYIQENKRSDSIEYYLNRSTTFLSENPTYIFEKTILHNQWGKFYEDRKNYKKALDSYKEAEKYGKESKANDEVLKAFLGLSRCYEILGDLEATVKYERRFSKLQDSIEKAKSKIVSNTIDHIVREKEQNIATRLSNFQKVMIVAVIIALCIILFLGFRMRANHLQKKKSKEVLQQKEVETQALKLKVNDSFEEVIQLAKTNSPEFWGRFQEVYPEFRNRLLSVNPDLKPSELILSAYIYLGFTTKDIADYTFKAVKTIKNNKYNLRKRLEIPTKDDFTIWMRNVVN